jgi:hypothetical protein
VSNRWELSAREVFLIWVLLALMIGMGWFVLLFSPFNEALASLKADLAAAETQLAQRQQWARTDSERAAAITALQVEIQEIRASLDQLSSDQDLLNYLHALVGQVGGQILHLDLAAEQLSLNLLLDSYAAGRWLVEQLEQCPNLLPQSLNLTATSAGFRLELKIDLTRGDSDGGAATAYPRMNPFAR